MNSDRLFCVIISVGYSIVLVLFGMDKLDQDKPILASVYFALSLLMICTFIIFLVIRKFKK